MEERSKGFGKREKVVTESVALEFSLSFDSTVRSSYSYSYEYSYRGRLKNIKKYGKGPTARLSLSTLTALSRSSSSGYP